MATTEFQPESLQRRKTETLVAWWRELNSWGWPKGQYEPAETERTPGSPRRRQFMDAIQMELGRRKLFGVK